MHIYSAVLVAFALANTDHPVFDDMQKYKLPPCVHTQLTSPEKRFSKENRKTHAKILSGADDSALSNN